MKKWCFSSSNGQVLITVTTLTWLWPVSEMISHKTPVCHRSARVVKTVKTVKMVKKVALISRRKARFCRTDKTVLFLINTVLSVLDISDWRETRVDTFLTVLTVLTILTVLTTQTWLWLDNFMKNTENHEIRCFSRKRRYKHGSKQSKRVKTRGPNSRDFKSAANSKNFDEFRWISMNFMSISKNFDEFRWISWFFMIFLKRVGFFDFNRLFFRKKPPKKQEFGVY